MATKSLSINYPDGDEQRFRRALRAHYGPVEDPPGSGQYRGRTGAEAWDEFERSCKHALRDIVRRVEREEAAATAVASIIDADIV